MFAMGAASGLGACDAPGAVASGAKGILSTPDWIKDYPLCAKDFLSSEQLRSALNSMIDHQTAGSARALGVVTATRQYLTENRLESYLRFPRNYGQGADGFANVDEASGTVSMDITAMLVGQAERDMTLEFVAMQNQDVQHRVVHQGTVYECTKKKLAKTGRRHVNGAITYLDLSEYEMAGELGYPKRIEFMAKEWADIVDPKTPTLTYLGGTRGASNFTQSVIQGVYSNQTVPSTLFVKIGNTRSKLCYVEPKDGRASLPSDAFVSFGTNTQPMQAQFDVPELFFGPPPEGGSAIRSMSSIEFKKEPPAPNDDGRVRCDHCVFEIPAIETYAAVDMIVMVPVRYDWILSMSFFVSELERVIEASGERLHKNLKVRVHPFVGNDSSDWATKDEIENAFGSISTAVSTSSHVELGEVVVYFRSSQ